MQRATTRQQEYLDRASGYVGRAVICYGHEMWPEAATHFGSALESLLRIRFGPRIKLSKLVEKFDEDPLFEGMAFHEGASKRCATCIADKIRTLRNAVHPECWKEATKADVDLAGCFVMMLYHILVVCDSTKIALFQDSPNRLLSRMEGAGLSAKPNHPSE